MEAGLRIRVVGLLKCTPVVGLPRFTRAAGHPKLTSCAPPTTLRLSRESSAPRNRSSTADGNFGRSYICTYVVI